jgi:hypothetical protein
MGIGGTMKFLLSERYRLELHWKKALRPKAGKMHLTGAYFQGPALQQADKINNNDSIRLDFCSQLIVLVKNVYVADLKWGEVVYNKNETITLKNARIEYDPSIKGIPNLETKDYLVIDTSGHENEKHLFNLLYPTYVIGKDNEFYNYRR